ncbi:MAG TPA: hypothetical protein VD963_06705, partial [Phycisphaerales bacterium]|nr:hypothetical protein [Phycisphaerales bacterium]
RSASRMQQTLKGVQARRTGLNAAAYEALNDPGVPLEAKAGVVNFVRKRLLVDRHKMEPERMARYTRKYGPLDWRHAGAHGLYWAARGVEEGMLRIGEQNRDDFDFVNTDRLVMHAIQELYRTGEITFDFFNPRFFMQLPNPDFVQSYVEAIEEIANREAEIATGRKGSKWYDPKTRLYTLYGAGFENFLRDAIRFLYRRGDREAAEHYRDVIVHYKGLNLNNQKLHESLTLPLDEFVVAEVRDDDRFTSPEVARSEVVGALQAAYLSGLLAGNSTAFRSNMDYARSFHKIYVEKQVFETAVNRGREARLEVMDRDFDVYAARVLAGLVQAAQIPDGPVMYQAAPADLQARTYAMLDLSGFKAEVDALAQGQEGAPTFDHWFPPPQGMEPVMEATREYLRTARAEHGVEVK